MPLYWRSGKCMAALVIVMVMGENVGVSVGSDGDDGGSGVNERC